MRLHIVSGDVMVQKKTLVLLGFQLCASTLLVETPVILFPSLDLKMFPIMRLHIVSGDLTV